VFGADRIGVRVSPSGTWASISDSDPEPTFGYFAGRLSDLKVAYLHLIEPRVSGTESLAEGQPPRHSYANISPDRSSPLADSMAAAPATSHGAKTRTSSRSGDCSPPTPTCLRGFVRGGSGCAQGRAGGWWVCEAKRSPS
jgi:hypothetical protein